MISGLYERKLGFGEIFKASWKIFSLNFKYLFVFAFILPVILKGLDYSAFISLPIITNDKMLVGQLKSLFSQAFGFISLIAVIFVVGQNSVGKQASWPQIIEQINRFFWAGFLINILSQLVSSLLWLPEVLLRLSGNESQWGGFLEFITSLIGISLMGYFCFAFPVLILRGKTGLLSFTYSFRTVRGRWWKIFGTMFFAYLILMIPCFVVVATLGRIIPMTMADRMFWSAPFYSFFLMYVMVFITILFLNIDRQNETRDSANPIIQSENT